MRTAFVVYPGFTALDVVGPYEVLGHWPGATVHFLAASTEPVRADIGLTVVPNATPETLPDPELILVGGAANPMPLMQDQVLIDWIKEAAPRARWVTSVCTGAGLLAAAGLLEGRRTTTHYAFRGALEEMGVDVVADRVVIDEPFASGAGVSAGIDLALALTARVHGDEVAKALQLVIEYDPEPPFDSGSPEKADPDTVSFAFRMLVENAS